MEKGVSEDAVMKQDNCKVDPLVHDELEVAGQDVALGGKVSVRDDSMLEMGPRGDMCGKAYNVKRGPEDTGVCSDVSKKMGGEIPKGDAAKREDDLSWGDLGVKKAIKDGKMSEFENENSVATGANLGITFKYKRVVEESANGQAGSENWQYAITKQEDNVHCQKLGLEKKTKAEAEYAQEEIEPVADATGVLSHGHTCRTEDNVPVHMITSIAEKKVAMQKMSNENVQGTVKDELQVDGVKQEGYVATGGNDLKKEKEIVDHEEAVQDMRAERNPSVSKEGMKKVGRGGCSDFSSSAVEKFVSIKEKGEEAWYGDENEFTLHGKTGQKEDAKASMPDKKSTGVGNANVATESDRKAAAKPKTEFQVVGRGDYSVLSASVGTNGYENKEFDEIDEAEVSCLDVNDSDFDPSEELDDEASEEMDLVAKYVVLGGSEDNWKGDVEEDGGADEDGGQLTLDEISEMFPVDGTDAAGLASRLSMMVVRRRQDGQPTVLACKFCAKSKKLREKMQIYIWPFNAMGMLRHLHITHGSEWREYEKLQEGGKDMYWAGRMPAWEMFEKRAKWKEIHGVNSQRRYTAALRREKRKRLRQDPGEEGEEFRRKEMEKKKTKAARKAAFLQTEEGQQLRRETIAKREKRKEKGRAKDKANKERLEKRRAQHRMRMERERMNKQKKKEKERARV